jgi:hypothetical protein
MVAEDAKNSVWSHEDEMKQWEAAGKYTAEAKKRLVEKKMAQMRAEREQRDAEAARRVQAEMAADAQVLGPRLQTSLDEVLEYTEEKMLVGDRRLDSDVLAYNEADQRILAQREALLQQEMDQAQARDNRLEAIRAERAQAYAQQRNIHGLDMQALQAAPNAATKMKILSQWIASQGMTQHRDKLIQIFGLQEAEIQSRIDAAVQEAIQKTKEELLADRARVIEALRTQHAKEIALLKSHVDHLQDDSG